MKSETWYVMEDGSVGDPREIAAGKDGNLRHKDGRAVAYAPHGPRSRSVDPEAERAKGKELPSAGGAVPTVDRDMKPEPPKRGYKTRAGKAE